MFLEKTPESKGNLLKYAIFIFSFLGFMILNFFASSESSKDVLKQSIANIGELLTFASLLFPFVFLMLFLLIWVKFFHKQSITSLVTSRPKIDYHRIFYAFSVWSLMLIFFVGVSIYISPADYKFQFDSAQFVGLLFISLLLIPIQTSFEELFFRGYMMQGVFKVFKNRLVPFLSISIIFGLMHLSNPEVATMGNEIMIMYIGSGLFLGALTLLDEGLELALGFHAANNLVGCVLVTSTDTVFQTPSLFKFSGVTNILEIYLQVFVIFPILLIIFSKKFGFKLSLKKLI